MEIIVSHKTVISLQNKNNSQKNKKYKNILPSPKSV